MRPQFRNGLHRIHVRQTAALTGYEQRFEYIVTGPEAAVSAFCSERTADGDHVSERRTVDTAAYALLLTARPVIVPMALSGVSLRDLRKDAAGKLKWLWDRADAADY